MSSHVSPVSAPTIPELAKPRRSWKVTLLAWTIWYVGAHFPIVTGVLVYVMAPLFLEDDWRGILATAPGLALALSLVGSVAWTVTFMLSGYDVYRGRFVRAAWWMVASAGAFLLTTLPIFIH